MMVTLFCIMAACVTAASFITAATCFVCECICWPFFRRCEQDLELGRVITSSTSHRGSRFVTYQTLEVSDNNYQILGSSSIIGERREQRQEALEKLLPLVKYGGSSSSSREMLSNFGDCSICLDDYRDGEFCRVFPVCKHIFHVKCIDHWLNNQLTCPICRKSLLDS